MVRFGVAVLPNKPWPDLVETWRTLDALRGVESVWVADQLANPYRREQPWFEAWSCLASLARETERVRIGPLVSPLTLHNPARLAKAAVTIDHASNGRLELAVGAGGSAFDHALAQVERWPPADRARRFEAFVARLLELLARDDLQPRPAQARIPLTVGGNGRSVLRVAARHADRWNTYVGWQLPRDEGRRVTRERNAELDRLCREAGRDPRTLLRSALIGHSFVAETPFASQHAFREFCLAYEDAGIDELIVYWPPEFAMPEDAFEPGLFERLFG
jgi:alkanesulfonate monooxygenase SsuD/methylene tetrahydromethanopterin reductase-like flavin-dependent oxidoreductase (luciferase family)